MASVFLSIEQIDLITRNLFSHIQNNQIHINEYLHQHIDRIPHTMPDKSAQLVEYLSSIDQKSY